MGPRETRVFEGPVHPEEGFPKRIGNTRDPDIDARYLKPSARQKALWLNELPNLATLNLQQFSKGSK